MHYYFHKRRATLHEIIRPTVRRVRRLPTNPPRPSICGVYFDSLKARSKNYGYRSPHRAPPWMAKRVQATARWQKLSNIIPIRQNDPRTLRTDCERAEMTMGGNQNVETACIALRTAPSKQWSHPRFKQGRAFRNIKKCMPGGMSWFANILCGTR
ncbi:hypothetical protein BD779DRAFT_755403 [Infundibulicybe gibba]|nr:hypothetical protein BD779DRAFT_755403 [Infundibulicybe gibba]